MIRLVFYAAILLCVVGFLLEPLIWLGLLPEGSLYVDRRVLAVYQGVTGLLWFIGLVLAVISVVYRALRYWKEGTALPSILVRDIISKTGLAIPIALVFGIRILTGITTDPAAPPLPDSLSNYLPWVLLTTIPALIGIYAFLYWELFIIERTQAHGETRTAVLSAIQRLSSQVTEVGTHAEAAYHEANTANKKNQATKEQIDHLQRRLVEQGERAEAAQDRAEAAQDRTDAHQAVQDDQLDQHEQTITGKAGRFGKLGKWKAN